MFTKRDTFTLIIPLTSPTSFCCLRGAILSQHHILFAFACFSNTVTTCRRFSALCIGMLNNLPSPPLLCSRSVCVNFSSIMPCIFVVVAIPTCNTAVAADIAFDMSLMVVVLVAEQGAKLLYTHSIKPSFTLVRAHRSPLLERTRGAHTSTDTRRRRRRTRAYQMGNI